ncbi:sugar ABC transporter permease [Paenibacillus sp. P26]|nr:sugar ABC transporter permease [Paenibacillus sp. P26]
MKTGKWSGNITAVPFLLPFFLVYVLFTVYPMFKGLQMSLYQWTLIKRMDFVGLANYAAMVKDPQFWQALGHTTLFVVLSTPGMIVLALILALFANMKTKFKSFFRGGFFLPSILSVSVISFLAIFMLRPYTGFINSLLHLIGIQAEPFWLADDTLAWISIIIVTLWWTVGFNMILYLAALQDIPDYLYDAGKIDGATDGQMFRYVTFAASRADHPRNPASAGDCLLQGVRANLADHPRGTRNEDPTGHSIHLRNRLQKQRFGLCGGHVLCIVRYFAGAGPHSAQMETEGGGVNECSPSAASRPPDSGIRRGRKLPDPGRLDAVRFGENGGHPDQDLDRLVSSAVYIRQLCERAQ